MEEGGFGQNRHTTFIVAEKAYFTVSLALFSVYVGEEGWLKTSYGGRGLAEYVRIYRQWGEGV